MTPMMWLKRNAKKEDLTPKPFRRGFLPGKGDGAISHLPAEFLVGPDLKIERAYYGKDIGDHLPIPEIDAWFALSD